MTRLHFFGHNPFATFRSRPFAPFGHDLFAIFRSRSIRNLSVTIICTISIITHLHYFGHVQDLFPPFQSRLISHSFGQDQFEFFVYDHWQLFGHDRFVYFRSKYIHILSVTKRSYFLDHYMFVPLRSQHVHTS